MLHLKIDHMAKLSFPYLDNGQHVGSQHWSVALVVGLRPGNKNILLYNGGIYRDRFAVH